MKYFEKLPIIFDELKLIEALREVEEVAPWPEQSVHKKYHQLCLTKREGQTAPEGYVAINAKSGKAIKLVDRLGFSYANFTLAKDWVSG